VGSMLADRERFEREWISGAIRAGKRFGRFE
jgi:hypothetical protein